MTENSVSNLTDLEEKSFNSASIVDEKESRPVCTDDDKSDDDGDSREQKKYYILDESLPFSQSSLWDSVRNFYSEKGPAAWQDNLVPSHITSNCFIANTYASLLLSFMHDSQAKRAAAAAARGDNGGTGGGGGDAGDDPCYIFELGAGHGKFGFLVVRKLLEQQENSPELYGGLRFVYVMSDLAFANLQFWHEHPKLREYVRRGLMDFALFDCEHDREVTLFHSQRRITPGSLSSEVVVIGNYIFDSLRCDHFRIKDGRLEEGLITVVCPMKDAKKALKEGETLQDCEEAAAAAGENGGGGGGGVRKEEEEERRRAGPAAGENGGGPAAAVPPAAAGAGGGEGPGPPPDDAPPDGDKAGDAAAAGAGAAGAAAGAGAPGVGKVFEPLAEGARVGLLRGVDPQHLLHWFDYIPVDMQKPLLAHLSAGAAGGGGGGDYDDDGNVVGNGGAPDVANGAPAGEGEGEGEEGEGEEPWAAAADHVLKVYLQQLLYDHQQLRRDFDAYRAKRMAADASAPGTALLTDEIREQEAARWGRELERLDSSFLYPSGTVQCASRARAWTRGGACMVVAADKGYASTCGPAGLREPHLAMHGCISTMVNFHALGHFVEAHGGFQLHSELQESSIKVGAYVFPPPAVPMAVTPASHPVPAAPAPAAAAAAPRPPPPPPLSSSSSLLPRAAVEDSNHQDNLLPSNLDCAIEHLVDGIVPAESCAPAPMPPSPIRAEFKDLKRTFNIVVNYFGPYDFFSLEVQAAREIEKPSANLALRLLRLSCHDPDVYYRFADSFLGEDVLTDPQLQADVTRAVEATWENFYALEKVAGKMCTLSALRETMQDHDVAFQVARYHFVLEDYAAALRFFDLSLDEMGLSYCTLFDKGLCYYYSNKFPEAIKAFKDAAVLNDDIAPKSHEWVERCERAAAAILAAAAGAAAGDGTGGGGAGDDDVGALPPAALLAAKPLPDNLAVIAAVIPEEGGPLAAVAAVATGGGGGGGGGAAWPLGSPGRGAGRHHQSC